MLVVQANEIAKENPFDVGLGSNLEFWLDRPSDFHKKQVIFEHAVSRYNQYLFSLLVTVTYSV